MYCCAAAATVAAANVALSFNQVRRPCVARHAAALPVPLPEGRQRCVSYLAKRQRRPPPLARPLRRRLLPRLAAPPARLHPPMRAQCYTLDCCGAGRLLEALAEAVLLVLLMLAAALSLVCFFWSAPIYMVGPWDGGGAR